MIISTVLPTQPLVAIARGSAADIQLIAGSNADEGSLFTRKIPVRSERGYRLFLRSVYSEDWQQVLALFPPGNDPQAAVSDQLTVGMFVSSTRQLARAQDAAGGEVRVYHFTRSGPVATLMGVGAAHGFEVPYLFEGDRRLLSTALDRRLAQRMRTYWTHFAATGDPNHALAPRWPLYQTFKDQHLELGDRITVKQGLWREACDFFGRRTWAELIALE